MTGGAADGRRASREAAAHRVSHRVSEKDARILIYCNNNFENDEDAFPSKLPSASLNVPTYISLFSYGYRNVYELGPLLDVGRTALVPEPTR